LIVPFLNRGFRGSDEDMRQVMQYSLMAMVAVTAIWASTRKAITPEGDDHGDAVRVSKTLAAEVSVPVCVRSGAQEVVIPVKFQNKSAREAVVVWEIPQSIRIWKQDILVGTGGGDSHEKQWITLRSGETAKREAVLKFGEDVPELDEGNYTLSLNVSVRDGTEARSRHEQLKVVIHATKPPVGLSLKQVVEAGGVFYCKTMRKNPVSTEQWEITPNMYRGKWQITFGAVSGPHAVVCVDKATGEASEPLPIP
jgi:hypothetical protein